MCLAYLFDHSAQHGHGETVSELLEFGLLSHEVYASAAGRKYKTT
jgi:hypothetical protein